MSLRPRCASFLAACGRVSRLVSDLCLRYNDPMISAVFNTLLYKPIYNALTLLISVMPEGDVGLAVILVTIFVKLALFSLAYTSIKGMVKQRALEPEIRRIKEKHKDNTQEQALAVMAFYKERGVNPFAGILVILIQIPVILALYFVFLRGGLPAINPALLYSFIPVPERVNMVFLGFLDLSAKSILTAILAGVSQYLQGRFMAPLAPESPAPGQDPSFKHDLARSMNVQIRYVLPAIIGIVAYTLPAAIGLYWTVSNLFTVGQEMFVRKRLAKDGLPAQTVKTV